MANLKTLRIRIASVKSTQKITAAMKMIAATKLRKAQAAAEEGRPYAESMERMLSSLIDGLGGVGNAPKLLAGSGSEAKYLLVVMTGDRGLCGAFNSNVVREAKRQIADLHTEGKQVKLLMVGSKGTDAMRRDYGSLIVDTVANVTKYGAKFDPARSLGRRLNKMFENGEFDVCKIIYNTFRSAISQVVTARQIIPVQHDPNAKGKAAPGRRSGGLRDGAGRPGGAGRTAARQPRDADLPGDDRKLCVGAGGADDGDGQRHPQCRRHDRSFDPYLQPQPPGRDHEGTDRDHLRRQRDQRLTDDI